MATIVASQSLADAATLTGTAYAYDATGTVVATCTNGATPPHQNCRVTLQLSTNNSTWTSVSNKWFGFNAGELYRVSWRMADYATTGAWLYYRLVFSGNLGAAVTIAASDTSSKKVAIIPLTATSLTTGGAIAAWQPPGATEVYITRALLRTTTKSTGAATCTIGTAANATTSSGNLMTTADIGTATIAYDNITNASTSGKAGQLLAAGSFVTATGSATSAGLVGTLTIEYVVPGA